MTIAALFITAFWVSYAVVALSYLVYHLTHEDGKIGGPTLFLLLVLSLGSASIGETLGLPWT